LAKTTPRRRTAIEVAMIRTCFAARLGFSLLAASAAVHADDGDADPAFGANGRAIHSWPSSYIQSETNAVATSADGGVLVAGWVSYPAPTQQDAISLLRFRADGTPDSDFGDGGLALFDIDPASRIGEAAIGAFALPDGRTLVAARRTVGNSQQPLLLAVNADGTPDTAFGTNGLRNIDTARWAGSRLLFSAALRDANGRVLLAGTVADGVTFDALVVRTLANGNVDASFGDLGWTRIHADGRLTATALALDDLGRVIVSGRAFDNTFDQPMVARLDAYGTPDISFGDGGLVLVDTGMTGNWSADAVASAVRPVAGIFVQRRIFIAISRGLPYLTGVFALANDGSIATSFADDGFLDLSREEGSHIAALAMRRDLRLVAAGWIDPNGAGTSDFFVARASFDGVLDSTFDGNGVARYPMNADGDTYDTPGAMVLSGERPVIAGKLYNNHTPSYHSGVLRLRSDALFADGFD
jgi:uncharacterized delta-60 repeat protein